MLIIVLLVVVVDVLLLSASGRLLGLRPHPFRILCGALTGGGMTAFLWLANVHLLSHIFWWIMILVITGFAGFGFSPAGIGMFVLLHLSLGNIADTGNEIPATVLGAVGITLVCALVRNRSNLVEISLSHEGKILRFRALRDTGNQLRDPVTGEPVLIVSEEIARQLTGLTSTELGDPVKSIMLIPGLRLIPYKTVGNHGFLLAMRIAEAKIGNRKGSALVALSPRSLGRKYQALTGGML